MDIFNSFQIQTGVRDRKIVVEKCQDKLVNYTMFNSTAISLSTENHTENGQYSGVLSPIHYIIIVLIFYMGGLTILIIKYVQVKLFFS